MIWLPAAVVALVTRPNDCLWTHILPGTVIPPVEWAAFSDDRRGHSRVEARAQCRHPGNYQTPEIFHCLAGIVGDSLALARKAMTVDADIIVLAGVHLVVTERLECHALHIGVAIREA